MNVRTMQCDDGPALVRLWNEAAWRDPVTPSLLEEKLWGDADFDPQLALVAEVSEHINAMAVGVCRRRDDRPVGFIKMLAVAPRVQRQGIATQLLALLEQRMSGRGVREVRPGESAPNYLTPGVDAEYEAARAFFEQHGYRPIGETCNLRVDLRDRTAWTRTTAKASDEASITLARASDSYEASLRKLVCACWPAWWDEVSVALGNDPATVFIARRGASVVGFAAHDANNRGTGWFGPMGTAPSEQGRGIGGRLLALCLDDMAASGLASATIPWVGPVAFYEKTAGAQLARKFVRYAKPLDPRSDHAC